MANTIKDTGLKNEGADNLICGQYYKKILSKREKLS